MAKNSYKLDGRTDKVIDKLLTYTKWRESLNPETIIYECEDNKNIRIVFLKEHDMYMLLIHEFRYTTPRIDELVGYVMDCLQDDYVDMKLSILDELLSQEGE